MAYVRVDTGVGALILFGTVQVTMILSAFLKGKRLDSIINILVNNKLTYVDMIDISSLISDKNNKELFFDKILENIEGISISDQNDIGEELANFLSYLKLNKHKELFFNFLKSDISEDKFEVIKGFSEYYTAIYRNFAARQSFGNGRCSYENSYVWFYRKL